MKLLAQLSLCVLLTFSAAFSINVYALATSQKIQQNQVLDISLQSINGRIAAAITFSAVIKSDINLEQWLSIDSDAGERIAGSWVLDDQAKVLYFTNIQPQSSYVVRVEKGLPFANLGLLEKGETSRLKVAPIEPILGFAGNGNLLATSLTDGLPVISVNVHNVDVDFYRVPQTLLVPFLLDNSRRGQQDFWQLEPFIEQLEFVYTGRFDLELMENQTATSYLPIKEISALQQAGVYVAIMRKAGEYKYSHPATWFAISDLGLHLRVYSDNADISVNSLATALPTAEVALRLLDRKGSVLAQTKSDQLGTARFSKAQMSEANLLVATHGQHTSIVRLFGPLLDLSEFPIAGISEQAERLFFYSARDIYRPQEQVIVSALLRDNDGQSVSTQVITFKLKQPDGRTVSEQRLRANALGYYESHWQLPKGAATGRWSVAAYLSGKFYNSYALQVEDFLPERMELSLSAADYVNIKDAFSVAVEGKYLYGAPAADNILQAEILTTTAAHPFKKYQNFYFSNPQITEYNRRKTLSDMKLDTQGGYQLVFDNDWHQAQTPMQIKVYTSLLDSGGRPVSRSLSSFALPAQQLIGIRPLFEDDTAPYDSAANFEILLSDGEAALAATDLQVNLIRERRKYHWLYTDSQGWTADYTEQHYSASQQKISVKAGEIATLSLPVDWGYYRIEVTNPMTQLVTGYKFRAGWSADETLMAGRPDRIGLAFDKQYYQTGDNVSVDIKAPAAGKGYLLVESDRALYRQAIDIPAAGASVSFTVQEGWNSHNLYVSVLLIQPGDEREEKLPRRMMGIAPLSLDRQDRKLQISLFDTASANQNAVKATVNDTASPLTIRPNTQLKIPLKVSVSEGAKPLNGPVQVTLAAVDVGVLNISRFVTPDPFDGFFQQRAYSASARDSYSDLIDAQAGVMATLKFGGDSDLEQGGATDPDVQIVSLFSGVVDVDAQGNAEVTLDIPDFNGRIRLMAVAFNANSFGSVEKELEVASPVIAQLTKPRFLRAGDTSQLALDLNNLSGIDQQIHWSMSLGEGLFYSDDLTSTQVGGQQRKMSVSLGIGQKKSFYLPITARDSYRAIDIDLTLDNVMTNKSQGSAEQPIDDHQDEGQQSISLQKHWQLSVKPAWPITDQQWQVALAEKQQFTLGSQVFASMLPHGLEGQLNVASQPPLDIASHFNALQAYPYGCLEQTTSGVFPQLYVNDQLLANLNIKGSDAPSRRAAINTAIQRLQGMQRSSGGFGLWSDQSPEEHWLSVYVFDFLLRAQEAGYQVPVQNLKKAQQRITTYLRSPSKIRNYYEDVNSDTKFAVRAYAGQVLSRLNQAPLSILRNLYAHRSGSDSPMALLQLALALKSAGDSKRSSQALSESLANLDRFGKNQIYFSSAVRDLALSAFWLLESKTAIKRFQPLLLALTERLSHRQWLSTQERNALFLLGKELKLAEGETMRLAWGINEKQFDKELQRLAVALNSQDLQANISVTNHSKAPVYLNLRTSGYDSTLPPARSNGLHVTRQFYHLNGKPLIASAEGENQQIRSGDKLIVGLTVRADQGLRHALLVDLLPAGLEIENQNLFDSYNQDALEVNGQLISDTMRHLNIANQEYRDDRFVMAIDLPEEHSVEVFYLVRAVSPGTYQIPPTFAEDMYRPNLRHQGDKAGQLRVLPR